MSPSSRAIQRKAAFLREVAPTRPEYAVDIMSRQIEKLRLG